MDSVDRLLKTIRGVSKTNPVTNLQLSEIIRSLWSDQGKIINIINNEIVNNTTNIYQSISQIIGSKQGDNHEIVLIENTANVSETVVSSWSVLPYNQQMGEFKTVVAVRNKITNTIITLISLLSFDYSDTIPALIQNDLLTDAALSLTVGVDGSNMLYATVSGMPEADKRIHFCLERCVLSERVMEISADFDLKLNVDAETSAYKEVSADFGLGLNMSADVTELSTENFALELTWDDIANVPVADASSVSSWNVFFDLPTYGTAFSSVVVDVNTVKLYGGSNIILKEKLFALSGFNLNLIKVEDYAGCVEIADNNVFGWYDESTDTYYICENLTTAKLPVLHTAGVSCFSECYSLSYVDFSSLTSASAFCFKDCEGLFSPDFSALTSIGEYCFYDCYEMLNPNFSALVTAEEGAFRGCENMRTSDFSSLITAGDYCFDGCKNFEDTDFSSLTLAGINCFDACIRMRNPNFALLQTASDSCFRGCSGLINPYLPALTIAGDSSFINCKLLDFSSISTLITAGDSCFYGCWQQTSISLPNLTTAGLYCFFGCGFGDPLIIDLPALISIGDYGFYRTRSCANFNLPVLENMGSSAGYNYVFGDVPNSARAITIPAALMTCNGGSPDGDILWLQSNGPLTITTV